MPIDWQNPGCSITKNFTVHDATYLASWRVHHIPTATEAHEIVQTAAKMEEIMQFLGVSRVIVTSWLRPASTNVLENVPGNPYQGRSYNASVPGAAKHSLHILGKAVDFVVPGQSCDNIREQLKDGGNGLEVLGICLEDMPGYNWLHIDLADPSVHGGHRAFKV